ncbi:MAG: peptidoglycan bridge formation glycyltransferase FemA/FemB family protein [Candidatus Moranbacteria bacterium]|nr:peptidoglycan bridge formation glycyltransferase FemA/FemB family protein [Candidatus Moranbacteria bacterium]MBP7696050.1 peptidoglycan bridge formation glycyltransferase FemA/FemB family protein [Candidatus Moranbacteria bacterium]
MNQFLQSVAWARFQESAGRKSIRTEGGAYGFVHALPLVGTYLYTPRWPLSGTGNDERRALLRSAEQAGCGWLRVEPETEAALVEWRQEPGVRIVKAPHDVQPRENLVIDITASEEDLMMRMKSKVRYNIRLAEKKGVRIIASRDRKYQEAFLDLIEATAKRQGILAHPKSYYEKMLATLPEEELSLYVAEYEGEAIAANIVLFSGDTATYLHGGTSDHHRETMAPFLLQWEQIKEAKRRGCSWYDFGGVNTQQTTDNKQQITNAWAGITRFKTGFAPGTETTLYPGCYDIIIDARKYRRYDRLRSLQRGVLVLRKFLR